MASLNVPYQGQRDEEIISNTTSEDEIELKSNFNRVKTSTKAISNSSSADSGENGHPGSPTGTSTADAPKPSSMNKRRYLNEIDSWGPADINEVRGSRRRIKTNRYDFEDSNNTEERLVQQAMKNSLVETKKIEFKAPSAPTYHPTVEEFRDPLQYIRRYTSLATNDSTILKTWQCVASNPRRRSMVYVRLFLLLNGSHHAK